MVELKINILNTILYSNKSYIFMEIALISYIIYF